MYEGDFDGMLDYIGISHALNSMYEFEDILKANDLNTNSFNSYANTCTGMNLALTEMGYVGLKYNTTEIEDLEYEDLGDRNAYLIFDKSAVVQI